MKPVTITIPCTDEEIRNFGIKEVELTLEPDGSASIFGLRPKVYEADDNIIMSKRVWDILRAHIPPLPHPPSISQEPVE